MKQRFLLSLFALVAGFISSAPVVICVEERAFPAKKTVARLEITHDVQPKAPAADVSISFLLPKDRAELNKFQKYGDRADVLASRSHAISQLVGVIVKKLETKTNFSLCFDCGLGEKNVVAQFAFLKDGAVRVTFVTATQVLQKRFVNVLKAILLDETVMQKHWGKGLVFAGIVVGGLWFATQKPDASGDDSPKQPRRNLAGGDDIPSDAKTLENYFGDYANNTTTFPYTCHQLTAKSDSTDFAPLRSLVGTLDKSGKLAGGMSFDVAESCHCWIQWAFPLEHQSGPNPHALISTDLFQKKMKSDAQLREVLLLCFRYYLNFMGLDLVGGCGVEMRQADIKFEMMKDQSFFNSRMQNFIENPHNLLRITRIITALRIHGLEEYSRAFYEFLIPKEAKAGSCLNLFNKRTQGSLGGRYKVMLDGLKKTDDGSRTLWEAAAYPDEKP